MIASRITPTAIVIASCRNCSSGITGQQAHRRLRLAACRLARCGSVIYGGMLARRHEDRHYPGSGWLLLRSPARLNRRNSSIARPGGPGSARTDQVRERDGSGRGHGGGKRRQPSRALLAGAVSLGLTCSGCGLVPGAGSKTAQPPASLVEPRSGPHPGPRLRSPWRAAAAACPTWFSRQMSEAQRVGQLFLVGIAGAPAAEVAQAVGTYHFGSLLLAGHQHGGRGRGPAGDPGHSGAGLARRHGPGPVLHRGQPGGRPGPGTPGTRLLGDPARAGPGPAVQPPNCNGRPRPGAASCDRRASTSTWPR